MIRKTMILLLASVLAVTYVKAQKIDGTDTAKTGCTYVVNRHTFELKSGYLWRLAPYVWDYQPSKTNRENADSVTLVKTKKYLSTSYYLVKDSVGKKVWMKVDPVQDFNVDYTLLK